MPLAAFTSGALDRIEYHHFCGRLPDRLDEERLWAWLRTAVYRGK